MTMEKYTVMYDEKIIKFQLQRKNVKNINLSVKPDMSVVVSASKKVPLDFILDFVKSKAPWILKNMKYFKKAQPDQVGAKEYISGESFKYLGKQYRLKVAEVGEREEVKYYQGFIYLFVKDKSNYKRKERLVQDWYREKAEINFQKSLYRMYPMIQKYGIEKPEISIRTMKARWGSCLREKNTILLNSELIKAPKLCIDYVMLHELIHFLYKDHNAKFYTFLTSLMPDWKKRKEILDEEVVKEL